MDRMRGREDDRGEPTATRVAQALLGFRHAFLDFATCAIYLSTDRRGIPANFHSYEGLPDEVVTRRWMTGSVASVKPSLIAGFERNGVFYTRRSAARAAVEWLVIR
ncbi:MAG TPA: hypothetical protein VMG61_00835 [Usitatibacter sp.]|nr:hypothetical protein [Usitatibacter sp.]